jgi:peptidoglycan/LPS O-acetylase OafA/YrhL
MSSSVLHESAPSESNTGPASHPTFRHDIEGLRGIAVLLVILFHSSVPGFSGGYVGVDIFFVISGFLITGTLQREVAETSTVQLWRFWARRLRRLVPALSVMIIVTWIAGLWIQSPLGWSDLAREGAGAATYTSNLLFAVQGGGYFANAESPFLHTWSLSVEEQFYIGWPLLVFLVAKVVSSRAKSTRPFLVGSILATTVVSFALCVVLTARGTPWAYFSAPTRAWEFGCGALLALSTQRRAKFSGRVSELMVVAGLGAILFASNRFDGLSQFPGVLAAVPVLGTVLVLLGGMHSASGSASKLLGSAPLQLLGRLSYSWYLWHWPFLIMTSRWFGPLTVVEKLAVSTLALGAAALSYRFVENPARYSVRLQKSSWSVGMGLASVVMLVVGSVFISRAADNELSDPYLAELLAARERRTEGGPGGCSDAVINGDNYCVFGPSSATSLLVLVGDSHAAQWSPAVVEAAAASNAGVLVRTYGGCPAVDVPVRATGKATVSAACTSFRADTMQIIGAVDPDLVVMSTADYTNRLLDVEAGGLLPRDEAIDLWAQSSGEFAAGLAHRQIPLVVIANNPTISHDPIECLARHRSNERCAERSQALLSELQLVSGPETQALERAGVRGIVAVAPLMCDEVTCNVIDDSGPIFSDSNHLSRSFVLANVDSIEAALSSVLRRINGQQYGTPASKPG